MGKSSAKMPLKYDIQCTYKMKEASEKINCVHVEFLCKDTQLVCKDFL